MCGKSPTVPKVVERDPIAEQRQAEAEATVAENSERATRRKRRNRSSLLTMGAGGAPTGSRSLLAQASPNPPGGG